jgi:hypothetical protein
MKNRLNAAVLGAVMSWGGWEILRNAFVHGPQLAAGHGPVGLAPVSWDQPVGFSMLALGFMMILGAWSADLE